MDQSPADSTWFRSLPVYFSSVDMQLSIGEWIFHLNITVDKFTDLMQSLIGWILNWAGHGHDLIRLLMDHSVM